MTGQLRTCLLWIVVLNVVFVQITAAVSAAWMVPLFSLAIASPWMARVQHRWDYRLAWNVALLGIFALLILHIRQSGIRFMLEDGLILAALLNEANVTGPSGSADTRGLSSLGRKQKLPPGRPSTNKPG